MGFESLPRGAILIWTGTLAKIPKGWKLCDGSGGRPNLLSRYLIEVPNTSTDPGSMGGGSSHSHTLDSHNHGSWSHGHSCSGAGGATANQGTGKTYCQSSHWHNWNNTGASTGDNTDSLNSQTPEPPYYQVAYIIKVS